MKILSPYHILTSLAVLLLCAQNVLTRGLNSSTELKLEELKTPKIDVQLILDNGTVTLYPESAQSNRLVVPKSAYALTHFETRPRAVLRFRCVASYPVRWTYEGPGVIQL